MKIFLFVGKDVPGRTECFCVEQKPGPCSDPASPFGGVYPLKDNVWQPRPPADGRADDIRRLVIGVIRQPEIRPVSVNSTDRPASFKKDLWKTPGFPVDPSATQSADRPHRVPFPLQVVVKTLSDRLVAGRVRVHQMFKRCVKADVHGIPVSYPCRCLPDRM